MTSEFRRAHTSRTHVGDVFRDPQNGQLREVVQVWGAGEYIALKCDGRYYGYRTTERNSLAAPKRLMRPEPQASNWRLT